MKRLLWFAFAIFLTREISAQSSDPEASGRVEQIQEQRLEKLERIGPDPPAATQKSSSFAKYLLHHTSVSVEGLGTGHGPTIGSAFQWPTGADRILLKLWGSVAVHAFYTAGTGVELRRFSTHDATVALEGSHSDAPQLDYYGLGPNSSTLNHTDFRREDTLFNLRARLREHRGRFEQACNIGQLLLNIGPGTNDYLPSTQSIFGPIAAPGIQTQSNFLISGCFGEVDLRDTSENPHSGTLVEANFNRYLAEGHDQFSFYRLSMIGEQYFPFLNGKRVIAIRGLSELSFHSSNQVVPFYLQPTLGSETELRGYPRYRFYDENSVAFTAEYRWEINSGYDMSLFADAGNVFPRPGEISLSSMKTSAGFGFRLKNLRSMTARLDIGFSREGFQVWFNFAKRL